MSGSTGIRLRKVVNDDSVRLVVGRPRRIPRRKREEVASVLAQDLLGTLAVTDVRRFSGRYGSFHVLLKALRDTEEWRDLRALAAESDILATLALRSMAPFVLDVLDRTTPLPADSDGEKSLNGLIALTLSVWQRRSATDMDTLVRGVEELERGAGAGDAREALRETLRPRLAAVVEETRTHARLLTMMKEMLPSGNDESFVEEVFMEYIRDIGRMAELLRRSGEIQHIIDLMSQLDVEYGAKRDRVQSFRPSEAYDLGLSKDVRHVLPVELLKLKDPTLRLLFFSQMLEGELLTYQLRGLDWSEDPESKKGPVIALIDASGSMSGPPEILAKAFILMLAKRMEREGRDIKVILFAAEDWKLEINLMDRKMVARGLLDVMCRYFEGGTDFNSALRVGLETVQGKKWKGADVLLFTDGESRMSDEGLVRDWNEFKRRTRSRIYTLIVNNASAGGLEKVSDKVWTLPEVRWDVEGSPSAIIKLIARH
ncbi:MAG: VWA domain-containing protein [Methanomassiliicoccus sp.]|nr:VWA domain-containing protein [Methanomassiliicoccus sp.]